MEQKIIPHLWFDTEAVEAMDEYIRIFPGAKKLGKATLADTPSGEVDMVSFEVMGLEMAAISAGPFFKTNPSISFFIELQSEEQLRDIWQQLCEGGTPLMPLQDYPFSELFGWVEDRFGVSWQLSFDKELENDKISTMLLFTQDKAGSAEAAMNDFVKLFPESEIHQVTHFSEGMDPEVPGHLMAGSATLAGQSFLFMDSSQPHEFTFSNGVSLMIYCENQEEIDYYWNTLSHVPEAEECGWLCDQYGISWQVVPGELTKKMFAYDWETLQRVNKTLQTMKKLDMNELVKAEQNKQS